MKNNTVGKLEVDFEIVTAGSDVTRIIVSAIRMLTEHGKAGDLFEKRVSQDMAVERRKKAGAKKC